MLVQVVLETRQDSFDEEDVHQNIDFQHAHECSMPIPEPPYAKLNDRQLNDGKSEDEKDTRNDTKDVFLMWIRIPQFAFPLTQAIFPHWEFSLLEITRSAEEPQDHSHT